MRPPLCAYVQPPSVYARAYTNTHTYIRTESRLVRQHTSLRAAPVIKPRTHVYTLAIVRVYVRTCTWHVRVRVVFVGCVGVVKAVSPLIVKRREQHRGERQIGGKRGRAVREGMSLELSCRRMRALRLAAEGEARQRLLIHQDPPTNSR